MARPRQRARPPARAIKQDVVGGQVRHRGSARSVARFFRAFVSREIEDALAQGEAPEAEQRGQAKTDRLGSRALKGISFSSRDWPPILRVAISSGRRGGECTRALEGPEPS